MAFLIFLVFSIGFASAANLSEAEVYYRCHSQFTRSRPSSEDSLLKQIKSKSLTGSEACKKLIQNARLAPDGLLANLNKSDSDKAIKVLRTIQSIHSSWFTQKDFIQDEVENVTFNLFDSNEMGYHLTYNLLSENSKASELLTRPQSFRAVRHAEKKPIYIVDMSSPLQIAKLDEAQWGFGSSKDPKKIPVIKPKLIDFGALVGIQNMQANENTFEFIFDDESKLKFDISDSLGGGILGVKPYILLNTTQKQFDKSDGGNNSHRSWSKAVYNDLLCRSLPVIEESDVKYGYDAASNLSFRKSATCMHCHSSMDPMADVLRNVFELRTAPKDHVQFKMARVVGSVQPVKPAEDRIQDADAEYYLRQPNGRLYFRNYKGELIDKKVENLKQLGEAIAETDDFYICLAKKYFEYMTAISVLNYNVNVKLNEDEVVYRDFVIQLGLDLKKSQKLFSVIEKIIDSPFYRSPHYGVAN